MISLSYFRNFLQNGKEEMGAENFIKNGFVSQKKAALREEMLLRRGEMPRLFPEAAVDVRDRILFFLRDHSISPPAKIAGYWPIGSELDIRPLLYALDLAGFTCALPVLEPGNPVLQFALWRSGDGLILRERGVLAPQNQALITELDVLLLPLLSFDLEGNRLGRGGGYYDRTLKSCRTQKGKKPLCLGIGFSDQGCDLLPHEPFDEKMDGIVTEKGLPWLIGKGFGPPPLLSPLA